MKKLLHFSNNILEIKKELFIILLFLCSTLGFAQTITPTKTATPRPGSCGIIDVELTIKGEKPVKKYLDVVLVIDVSGSMGDGTNPKPMARAKTAAIEFIDNVFDDGTISGHTNNDSLRKNRVAIVKYSNTGSIVQPLTGFGLNGSGKQALINAVNALVANGSTNIQDGIVKADQELNNNGHFDCNTSRSIVLLTDGVANRTGNDQSCASGQNGSCIQSAITAANEAKTGQGSSTEFNNQIFTVGLFGAISGPTQADAEYALNQIQSAGAYFTEDAANLSAIYAQIFAKLSWVAKGLIVKETIDPGFTISIPSPASPPLNPTRGTTSLVNQVITWNVDFLTLETLSLKYELTPKPGTCGPKTVSTSSITYTNSSCLPDSKPDIASDVTVVCPTTAIAGADQIGAATCGLTTVTLAGNTPTVGTGKWTVVIGTGGSFASDTSPTTTFSGIAGTAYTLRWTISSAPCTLDTFDDVDVKFNQNPTTATAGADQIGATTCGLTTVTLGGNTPSIGTGKWTVVIGTGGSFASDTNPTTTFTGTVGTAYTLRWTISNAPCAASSDDVDVKFNQNPTVATAGADQIGSAICGLTTVTLGGNTPTIGTGKWTVIIGTGGSFTSDTNPTTTFSGTAGTAYTLRWTISNAPCAASSDDVDVKFNQNPTVATAGADQIGSATCGLTTVILGGNTPTIGTGKWTVIIGTGGSFTSDTNPTTTFSGTAGTAYTLRWTISNAPCAASSDDVDVKFNQNPTVATAGADQIGSATCGLTTVTLGGNTPSVGTGKWTVVVGTGGSFASDTNPATTFSGTAGTAYTLRWTISNAPCAVSSDDVNVKFNQNPTTATAGADQIGSATCGLTTVTLGGNTPSVGTGKWTVVLGTGGSFALDTNPATTFSGTAGAAYTLRWTISNVPCTATSDDVNIKFNPSPDAPISGGNISECKTPSIQTLTATATVPNGQHIDWYDAETDGTIVQNPTWNTLGTVTYYAQAVDNDTFCISSTRTPVILTINSCSLEITKDGTYDDTNGNNITDVGDTVKYNFVIKNTGEVTLTNIMVADINADITGGSIPSLAPDATDSTTFSGSHVITQEEINTGYVYNWATATGIDPEGKPVTDTSTDPTPCTTCTIDPQCPNCTITPLTQSPGLTVVKTATPQTYSVVGDVINYTITVTNTGNVTLHQITVTDPLTGLDELIAVLAPNANTVYTTIHTITQEDLDKGFFTNIANANGFTPNDNPIPATDDETVNENPNVIDAVEDTAGPIDGINGATDVLNVFSNDTLNTVAVNPADVTLTLVTPDATGYMTMNPDGSIDIKDGTPAGTYTLIYQICENANSSNCDSATVTLTVICNNTTKIAGIIFNAATNTPLANVPVTLIPQGTTTGPVLIRITNAQGYYNFTGMVPGDYLVQVQDANLNSAYQLYPVNSSLFFTTLVNCVYQFHDFGYDKANSLVIGDFVWYDLNNNGLQDEWFDANNDGLVTKNIPDANGSFDYSQWEWLDLNGDGSYSGPLNAGELNAAGFGNAKSNNIFATGPNNYSESTLIGIQGYYRFRPDLTAYGNYVVELKMDDNLIAQSQAMSATGLVKVLPNSSKIGKTSKPTSFIVCGPTNANPQNANLTAEVTANLDIDFGISCKVFANLEAIDDLYDITQCSTAEGNRNVLDNDLANGVKVNKSDLTFKLLSDVNQFITFNDTGDLTIKEGVTVGKYTFEYQVCEVKNPSNCDTATVTINIIGISPVTVTISGDKSLCNDDSTPVDLNAYLPAGTPTGGTWIDTDNTGGLNGNILNAFGIPINTYHFEYKIAGDCPRSILLVMDINDDCKVLPCNAIIVHNAFSANEDGRNDYFQIENIEGDCYKNIKVEIFNRWGVLVFEKDNYNNGSNAFRGRSEGRTTINKNEGLPTGTYFYIISYDTTDDLGKTQSVKKDGYLYLIK